MATHTDTRLFPDTARNSCRGRNDLPQDSMVRPVIAGVVL